MLHMSLVIHVSLVGICNFWLVEEHIPLGICVSLVGEHMSLAILEICVSLLVEEHISLRICVSHEGNT